MIEVGKHLVKGQFLSDNLSWISNSTDENVMEYRSLIFGD